MADPEHKDTSISSNPGYSTSIGAQLLRYPAILVMILAGTAFILAESRAPLEAFLIAVAQFFGVAVALVGANVGRTGSEPDDNSGLDRRYNGNLLIGWLIYWCGWALGWGLTIILLMILRYQPR